MLENTTEVTLDNLVDQTQRVRQSGARLITATCLDEGDHFDVIYHFDVRGSACHLRLNAPKGAEVPSISGIFPGAFLIENEMKELIGLNVVGMSIDYGGRLFSIEGGPTLPLAKPVVSANGAEVK
jgi:Ni,Fe-hydrogenase III component G